MKRLINNFVTGLTRLAFWRKPVPVVEENQESTLPVLTELLAPVSASVPVTESPLPDSLLPAPAVPDQSTQDAMSTELLELSEHSIQPEQPEPVATIGPETEASTPAPAIVAATSDQAPAVQKFSGAVAPTEETAPEKLSLLARLKKVFLRKGNPGTAENVEAGQSKFEPPDGRKPDRASLSANADEPAEAAPEKLSLLTRLRNVFRRKSGTGAENDAETTASGEAAPAEDGEMVEAGRFQRALASLSNKWVWIPGVSVIVLVPFVVMAVLLMQSAQEKTRLQVELQAAQQKLKQSQPVTKLSTSPAEKEQTNDTLEPGENSMPVIAGNVADSGSGGDAGDCVVTDQASVIKNLKNCIEGFNRTSAR